MQKNYVILVTLALTFWVFSCGNQPVQENTTETTQTEASDAPLSTTMPYVITVLKGDIPSPRKEMKGTIGDAEVTVNYGSPSVKSRDIWGALVPYGEVWRTGANEATTVTFSKDVVVEGKPLAAGTYGLFTIPGENSWTIIFNKNATQWGSNDYSDKEDALRVTVTPQGTDEGSETLDFVIDGSTLVLRWEMIAVPIKMG